MSARSRDVLATIGACLILGGLLALILVRLTDAAQAGDAARRTEAAPVSIRDAGAAPTASATYRA